jgi:fatty-acyl-CoA synthase
VIATRDPYRGESVKALIVLRTGLAEPPTPQAISDWAREHMAVYKVPRLVEFVEQLPKSATGKLLWRRLQAEQDGRDSHEHGARQDSAAPRPHG